MKKFYKIMAVVLALAMTAALSVGLTLAYLTDQEEAVNVMTLGNVDIEQLEYQRAEGVGHINAGAKEGDLVPFVQGQPLYPAVPANNALTDYSAENGDVSRYFYWGEYSPGANGLWNDDLVSNVMDKFVFVKNTGKSDAYYRTIFAFECPEGMKFGLTPDDGGESELMMNTNSYSAFTWEGLGYTEINGTRYKLMVANYANILKPQETSRPSLLQVLLTHHATNEDMELLGDTYEILVVSQAVQVEGFADAKTALNTAFGEITTTNHPWSDGVPLGWTGSTDTAWYSADKDEFVITTASQLAGLAEMVNAGNNFKGKTVKLAANIDLADKPWTPIGNISNGFFGTFDGQNYTVSNLNVTAKNNAGLFGYALNGGNIKNLTVKNAVVKAEDYAGAILGRGYTDVVNCHAENVKVTVTPYYDEAKGIYDGGAKAGAVVGQLLEGAGNTVVGCTATNVEITGYRDLGGVLGMAHNNNSVSECSATDVTIRYLSVNGIYDDGATPNENAGAIVGRIQSTATVDFTAEENSKFTLVVPVSNVTDLSAAINNSTGATNLSLDAGTYRMPSVNGAKEFTISGTKDTVIDLTWGAYMDSSKVSFEGVTIKGSTGYATSNGVNYGTDYAALYSPNVTYTDCTFEGPFRIGRDGATFINCTFTKLGNDYVWTYGNDATFIGCTFETDGKSLLIYSDGGNEVSQVVVKDCVFNATASAKAGAISNLPCAAIEIQNYGVGVNLTTSGNVVDDEFSGEWRIKTYHAGRPAVIVNGTEYTSVAVDGVIYNMFGKNALALSDASFASITTNRNDANTISSVEVYTAQDLKTVNEMIHSGLMCFNGVNDIRAKIIFKADIDFGGADWKAIPKDIDIEGNSFTWSNVNFLPNANGQGGIYSYSGNCRVDGLTLKNITASGSQAGAFAGNATNTHLTNCALEGTITINWTETSDPYNGVGAVFGVISDETNTVNVNVTGATIVINKDGITYPAGFGENADKLVGVVYGGNYTK